MLVIKELRLVDSKLPGRGLNTYFPNQLASPATAIQPQLSTI